MHDPSPVHATETERSLLFGTLALQADLLTPEEFADVWTAWTVRRERPLADLLVARGRLAHGERDEVERLVQRKLRKHRGDLRAGLADLMTGSLCKTLTVLDDPALEEQLAEALMANGAAHSSQAVPVSTNGEALRNGSSPAGYVDAHTDRTARPARRRRAWKSVAAPAVGALFALAAGLALWMADRGAMERHREAERARANRPQERYLAALADAQQAWRDGHFELMKADLEAPLRLRGSDPDPRGFEWHYLWRQAANEPLVLSGPMGLVTSVAFSPDGRSLVAAGRDGTLRLWDVTSGLQQGTLARDKDEVLGVAFSPDGKLVASAGYDGKVRLWDVGSRKSAGVLEGHEKMVYAVAFRPDGKQLASASADKTIRLWNLTTQQGRILGHGTRGVYRVDFSPDGKKLVSTTGGMWEAAGGEVTVWDLATGKQLWALPEQPEPVHMVAYSPDGRFVASAGNDKAIKLWDAATGARRLTLEGNTAVVTGLAFSPDGKRVASASTDRTVRLWELERGREVLLLRGLSPNGMIPGFTGIAFSPDGNRIAAPDGNGVIRVWEGQATDHQTAVQREAAALVEALFLEMPWKPEVLDRLRHDPKLDEPLRKAALAHAQVFRLRSLELNNASWYVVRWPGAAQAQYERALKQAEEACRLAPGDGASLNTLGVAQYRLGRYEEALKTLTQSEKLNSLYRGSTSLPADLAFLAMCHQQLGQRQEARAELERLRRTVGRDVGFREDLEKENAEFLREAEALIEGVERVD
jgi:hypothetical protein